METSKVSCLLTSVVFLIFTILTAGFDEEQLYHGNNTNDVSEQCLREGSEGKSLATLVGYTGVLTSITALCQTSQQPMYKPFPVQQYRTPRDHHQSEGHVTCWNGMEAFLPPDHKGSDGKEVSKISSYYLYSSESVVL